MNKSNVEAYVHIEKGGAHQELDEDKDNHVLVRFSGYVARWARNSSKHLREPNCDEHCLPRKIFFSLPDSIFEQKNIFPEVYFF